MSSQSQTFAFIITAKTCNAFQQHLLQECVKHIRAQYPTHTIYILDDNSPLPPKPQLALTEDPHLHIYPALSSGAGELNAYLFSVDARCLHTRVVFIHDSVFLKSLLPSFYDKGSAALDTHPFFQSFWQATRHVWTDIFTAENKIIFDNMVFYFDSPWCPTKTLLQVLREFQHALKDFAVTFGAMGMFNTAFVRFVQSRTNLFAIAHLFTTRSHRCLFERIISCLLYMQKPPLVQSLCGDIFKHPAAFKNTSINLSPNSKPTTFVKVWQGR
jgi:hypothetical protein